MKQLEIKHPSTQRNGSQVVATPYYWGTFLEVPEIVYNAPASVV
jgi:hypothetical protein